MKEIFWTLGAIGFVVAFTISGSEAMRGTKQMTNIQIGLCLGGVFAFLVGIAVNFITI
jgi:hypothetical protein